MTKAMYIGVGGVARKVKKMYIGVDNVARKVKKGYIGVGGVARCFFSSGELAYYGNTTNLDVSRYHMAATTVGDYALFGGGFNGSAIGDVEVYDTNLTHSTAPVSFIARYFLSATTVGNYALFAGGYDGSNARRDVTVYTVD